MKSAPFFATLSLLFTGVSVSAFATPPTISRVKRQTRSRGRTSSKSSTCGSKRHYYRGDCRLCSSSSSSSSDDSPQINPNDLESDEERRRRMTLVRQIQKSFYSDGSSSSSTGIQKNSTKGMVTNVPLWRVQWTELPGYQNVLNCHVAHYTHMFQGVVNGRPRPWYFGHVYLPGGSDNLENPRYRLCEDGDSDAAHVGVLMKVSDYRQLDDGRLLLIAQALGRFRIVDATQHAPYAIANVELTPDRELIQQYYPAALDLVGADEAGIGSDNVKLLQAVAWEAARIAAVNEAMHWETFEYRNVYVNDTLTGGVEVSPIANYDSAEVPTTAFDAESAMRDYIDTAAVESSGIEDLDGPPNDLDAASFEDAKREILNIEREVWKDVDYLIQLLGALNPNGGVPVPTQLLGLLPSDQEWPEGFKLNAYVDRLKAEKAVVGTASKSPFVAVDDAAPAYPDLRRAQRLSFGIWVLLDSLLAGFSPAASTRQSVLELDSIWERLDAALRGLNAINTAAKEYIREELD
eukprot:CAMPEP_0178492936 /NCGR_PEP_ID=MMETSP0696-20121128/12205_1 /TAXON_ID=265572 /ORGANISM="Extubocellulus spinifer, Strain CCMP396" /LENGTH=519 /DNA_ID=CAMNT_0020120897 /DNA_START=44 /DNA_END=1599 /DNA_ORIENTATION=-